MSPSPRRGGWGSVALGAAVVLFAGGAPARGEDAPPSPPTTPAGTSPAAGPPPADPRPPFAVRAAALVRAVVAQDDAQVAALAKGAEPDPFAVANQLWTWLVRAPNEEVREADHRALVAYVGACRDRREGAGLAAFLDAALAADADARAADAALWSLPERVRVALAAGRTEALAAAAEEARALVARAPWSLNAFGAAWAIGHGRESVDDPLAPVALREARDCARRLRWPTAEVSALRAMAVLADGAAEPRTALALYGETEALASDLGLAVVAQRVRCGVGGALIALGRFVEARDLARALLATTPAVDPSVAIGAHEVLAGALAALGDRDGARAAAARAADGAAAFGDTEAALQLLFRRALLCREQDAWGEALDAFIDLADRARRADAPFAEFLAHHQLAGLYRSLGRPERSLAEAERALELIARRPPDATTQDARASLGLSRLLVERAKGPVAPDAPWLLTAVDDARAAMATYDTVRLTRAARIPRGVLARLLLATGDRRAAIETLEVEAARPGLDPDRSEAGVLLRALAAEDALAAGRYADAAHAAQRALDGRRRLARGLGEDDALGTRAEAASTAALAVTACARWAAAAPGEATAAATAAFTCAESARAALLADGLASRSALLWRGAEASLIEEDRASRAAVVAARERALAARGADAVAAAAALDAAWKRRDDAVARVQRASARAAAFVDPPAPDLAATCGCLAPEDALVLYRTTGGDDAHALVVRRGGARLVTLGPAAAIDATTRAWLRLAATDGADDTAAAARAYDALVRPLEAALGDARHLAIVPDGTLAFAPFEALLRVDSGVAERVVARHEVVYAPSAGVLGVLSDELAREVAGDRVLAVGDPALGEAAGAFAALPGGADEARAIVARFPPDRATLLVGAEATEDALLAALGAADRRYRVVHLACHGLVDPERPRGTGLLLAGGRVLDVDRIVRERWRTDLLVLSACESGRGRVVRGEGVFGLVRAALLAGVPRVVTSQWVVSDLATRRFMDRFYAALLDRGLTPAAALADAKRASLAAGGPDAAPARWAAFVLWGTP